MTTRQNPPWFVAERSSGRRIGQAWPRCGTAAQYSNRADQQRLNTAEANRDRMQMPRFGVLMLQVHTEAREGSEIPRTLAQPCSSPTEATLGPLNQHRDKGLIRTRTLRLMHKLKVTVSECWKRIAATANTHNLH